MTRQECEQKVLDLLEEIRDTISEYDPKIPACNLYVDHDCVWGFKLAEDENGERIEGQYLIDAYRRVEEDSNERMAV